MVVRWNATRIGELKQTVKSLRSVHAHIAGTVLSMVDVKRHARYEYEDSGLYAGKLKKYYAS